MRPSGPPENDELSVVVPRIVGHNAEPGNWSVESIFDPVASATAGIWRYRGRGWSAILKLLHHSEVGSPAWLSGDEESHWYYWRREALAYETGLLDDIAGPLRTPRCFGTFARPSGAVALWLEDLGETDPATSWPVDRYRAAATHLGIAQGSWLSRGWQDAPWLSHDWLRAYVERRAVLMAHLDDDELARRYVGPTVVDRIRQWWNVRERLLGWVEAAPTTICHLDLHPKNLFDDGHGTVLIDWAFAGAGRLGEDAGNLVFDAIWDFHQTADDYPALDESITSGYLAGIEASGAVVDPRLVELAILASGCVKYLWILPAMIGAVRAGMTDINHRPAEETVAWWSPLIPRVAEYGDRAATLASELGL